MSNKKEDIVKLEFPDGTTMKAKNLYGIIDNEEEEGMYKTVEGIMFGEKSLEELMELKNVFNRIILREIVKEIAKKEDYKIKEFNFEEFAQFAQNKGSGKLIQDVKKYLEYKNKNKNLNKDTKNKVVNLNKIKNDRYLN